MARSSSTCGTKEMINTVYDLPAGYLFGRAAWRIIDLLLEMEALNLRFLEPPQGRALLQRRLLSGSTAEGQ